MRENRPSSSMRGEARRSLAPASQSVRFAYSTQPFAEWSADRRSMSLHSGVRAAKISSMDFHPASLAAGADERKNSRNTWSACSIGKSGAHPNAPSEFTLGMDGLARLPSGHDHKPSFARRSINDFLAACWVRRVPRCFLNSACRPSRSARSRRSARCCTASS